MYVEIIDENVLKMNLTEDDMDEFKDYLNSVVSPSNNTCINAVSKIEIQMKSSIMYY
jgi:hypothetical protein